MKTYCKDKALGICKWPIIGGPAATVSLRLINLAGHRQIACSQIKKQHPFGTSPLPTGDKKCTLLSFIFLL
ncbi:hypothetical protein WN943_009124 [Citrus x changshan-huyou]